MIGTFQGLCLAFGSACLVLSAGNLYGDAVRLRDGSTVRGRITNPARTSQEALTIETLAGVSQTLQPGEIVYVLKRPRTHEEYEARLESLPETVVAHSELAEWCRKQGLDADRRLQLERVLDLDPQNPEAHRGLGHVQFDGEWISVDEKMWRLGKVKYQGRYLTPDEVEISELSNSLKATQKDWLKRIAAIREELRSPRRNDALLKVSQIVEPSAVPALQFCFRTDPDEKNRRLLVETLSRIHSSESTAALVWQGLFDPQEEISDLAFRGIPDGSKSQGVEIAKPALKHSSNTIVNRAARGIAILDGKSAIHELILALDTSHVVPVEKVVTTPASINGNADGSLPIFDERNAIPLFGGYGWGARFPGTVGTPYQMVWNYGYPRLVPMVNRHLTTVPERRTLQNPQVLDALRQLTQVDFGYDDRAWSRWWNLQNPITP